MQQNIISTRKQKTTRIAYNCTGVYQNSTYGIASKKYDKEWLEASCINWFLIEGYYYISWWI